MIFSCRIEINGHTALNVPDINTIANGVANSVFCPLGPAHTEANILVSESVAKIIRSQEQSGTSISWKSLGDSKEELTFSGLRLLKTQKVFHGKTSNSSAVLLTLVDRRYMASINSSTEVTISNLKSYAQKNEWLEGTERIGSWSDLLKNLWDNCGIGGFPGLPKTLPIDGKPNGQWLIGMNAWKALNSLLDQLDCAICHNPFTNTYSIVQLGQQQDIPQHKNRLKTDLEPFSGSCTTAETISVFFSKNHKAHGQQRDTQIKDNWAHKDFYHNIEVPTGIRGASGKLPIWDDLYYSLGENGRVLNNGATYARANNRKLRYVTRQSVKDEHKIFSGLIDDIQCGGKVRAVLWRNFGDPGNMFGGTCTEYVAGVNLVYGFKNGSSGVEYSFQQLESQSPPDLARRSYPNYPHLINIVQVKDVPASSGDPAIEDGDTVDANDDGLHLGKVRRYVSGEMQTLEDCWIRFVDNHDVDAGAVSAIQGEFYGPARLSGIITSQGQQLPLYLCKRGDGTPLTKFELTSDLSPGSTADAIIYGTETEITVRDWYDTPGMFRGFTGYRGFAQKDRETGYYDIVYMEHLAEEITFTLLHKFGYAVALTAQATLGTWTNGKEPAAEITVVDVNGHYPLSFEGAKGSAYYDWLLDQYVATECEQLTIEIAAEVTNLCVDSPSYPADMLLSSVSMRAVPFGKYFHAMPTTLPTTYANGLRNDFNFSAKEGDKALLRWDANYDETGGKWVIIQVSTHTEDMVTDVAFNLVESVTKLQKKVLKVQVYTCGEPAWADIVDTTTCPTPE